MPIGTDIDDAIAAAFDAARVPFAPAEAIEGQPKQISVSRRGAVVKAGWEGKSKKSNDAADIVVRAVGALAASLAIPLMSEDEAGKLAAAEGIVCHLTSLVLVDEAAEASEGVPANRKVELSRPRTSMLYSAKGLVASGGMLRANAVVGSSASWGGDQLRFSASLSSKGIGRTPGGLFDPFPQLDDEDDFLLREPVGGMPPDVVGCAAFFAVLASGAGSIDWDAAPDALRGGDLSSLSPALADAVREAAATKEIIEAASKAGVDPVAYVIALLARFAGATNRTAGRIARRAFKSVPDADVVASAKAIGF